MDAMKTAARRRKLQIFFDVLLSVSLVAVYMLMVVILSPYRRGFFCDDETIRYPYHNDTVTLTALIVFITGITPAFIVLVECVTSWRSQPVYSRRRSVFWAAICSAVTIYGFFWVGLMTTLIVTEVGKLTIGRLRPHFIDVCRPVVANSSSTSCSQNSYLYIEDYTCASSAHPRLIIEARKSFPSGHASLAAFTAIYLAFYVHRRLRNTYSQLLRLVVQLGLCSLAVYTAMSRVTDNKHHWSDVIVGQIIGMFVAVWTIIFFKKAVTWKTDGAGQPEDVEMRPNNVVDKQSSPPAAVDDDDNDVIARKNLHVQLA